MKVTKTNLIIISVLSNINEYHQLVFHKGNSLVVKLQVIYLEYYSVKENHEKEILTFRRF